MMLVTNTIHPCNPTGYNFLIQSYVMNDWSYYLISTCGIKKLSVQKQMKYSFIWLEISCFFLELYEYLMACVFWKDE